MRVTTGADSSLVDDMCLLSRSFFCPTKSLSNFQTRWPRTNQSPWWGWVVVSKLSNGRGTVVASQRQGFKNLVDGEPQLLQMTARLSGQELRNPAVHGAEAVPSHTRGFETFHLHTENGDWFFMFICLISEHCVGWYNRWCIQPWVCARDRASWPLSLPLQTDLAFFLVRIKNMQSTTIINRDEVLKQIREAIRQAWFRWEIIIKKTTRAYIITFSKFRHRGETDTWTRNVCWITVIFQF